MVLAFAILVNCGSFHNQKTVKLKSGRQAKVFVGTEISDSGVPVLIVEHENDVPVRKEADIENEILEIWQFVKSEAEAQQIHEAVIKYSFVTTERGHDGKKEGGVVLFTADLTESGRWSIRKVE